MLFQKKFIVVPVMIVLISVAFLSYFAYQYFNAYALLYKFHISVQALKVEREDSKSFAKTTLLLENPSQLDLKISYIQERIYLKETRVDDPARNFIKIDFLVTPFSNNTLTMRILLNQKFQNEDSNDVWHMLLYILIEDVPLLGDQMCTEYVSFES